MKFPVVDYHAHPAFIPFKDFYPYDDAVIRTEIDAIDRLHAAFLASVTPSINDAENALCAMRVHMDAIAVHITTAGARILVREWLGGTFQWVLDDLRYEYFRHVYSRKEYSSIHLTAEQQQQLDTLRRDGMYLMQLDAGDYEEIRRVSETFVPDLKRQVAASPAARAVYSPSRVSPLGRAITRAYKRAGVLDVLSEYKQNRMRILGTGLEYSAASQVWHSGLYADANLTDGPLSYLHNDEADHLPKSMLYVTPVTELTGPTQLIPGSNGWERSEFVFRAHKGLDRVTVGRYARFAPGSEYRITVRDRELRRIFMQLPRVFQGSSHFGDDFLPQSEIARELSARAFQFLPPNGAHALIFDGARTLHRGALVKEGERVALQTGFVNTSDGRVRKELAGGGPVRKLWRMARKLGRAALKG